MADHYYGVDVGPGMDPGAVTFGTSTGSTKVELRVTDATTGMTKTELLKSIDTIRADIVQRDEPA